MSDAANEDLVLQLFRVRLLSSGGAAEALGITRRDFLDLLDARDVPYLDLTSAELDDEIVAGHVLATATAPTV